jgi:hypothetical protein
LLLIRGADDPQEGIDVGEVIVHALKSVGLVVELREAMPGAVHYSKDLGHREHEVEDLREEEEDHGLREVTQNAHHGKSHPCEVAEGVTDEYFGGELIMLEETQGHKNEWDDDGQGEYVLRHCLGSRTNVNLDYIVEQDEAGDHEALTSLNTVDTCVDVD